MRALRRALSRSLCREMPTNFKSDNVTAACPEVMEALLRANADEAANSYGGTTGGTPDEPDPSTLAMNQLFAQTFECEVEVFPVVCIREAALADQTAAGHIVAVIRCDLRPDGLLLLLLPCCCCCLCTLAGHRNCRQHARAGHRHAALRRGLLSGRVTCRK